MKNKKNLLWVAILSVIMIAYAVIVILIAKNSAKGLDKGFWFTFSMMMISFLILLASTFFANKKGEVVLNAVSTAAIMYVGVMFVFTTILYFVDLSKFFVGAIIIWIVIFALFLILAIFGIRQRQLIQETKISRVPLTSIGEVSSYLANLKTKTNDLLTLKLFDEVINDLTSVSDASKDSDKQIFEYVRMLETSLEAGNENNSQRHLEKLAEMIKAR